MDLGQNTQLSQRLVLKQPIWNSCVYCRGMRFKELHDFTRHLRNDHCTVEGGSFVCRYGYNSVCNSLPVEGVSDLDYADHILKHHAFSPGHDLSTNLRRKQSTSSDASTVSFPADHSSTIWTMVSASQNLAAVLNDPGRAKQKDFFTKLWGADFIETPLANIPPNDQLPNITRAHFESYLKKIAKRCQRHEKLSTELPESLRLPGSRLRRARPMERRLDPLDIPPIFLQQDFDLSRPVVFYTAFPFAKNGMTVDGTFRQSGKLLQETLTHSLDQVEMRIADQVAEKSEGFFLAMTTHDVLMDHLAKTLNVVKNLRQNIKTVDKTMACQPLRLLRLQQSRNNHLMVLQKLKLMRTVQQTQPQIQVLLSAPDYVAALDLIITTREIVDHELAAVHSFRHLGPQLAEISRLIDKMMASEFETYSTRDLNRPLTDDIGVLEQDKLVSIMLGMLRRGNTQFINKYQGESFTAVRALVKQVVLESLADSDCETQGPYAAEQVSALPLSHFVLLMDTVTAQLMRLLKKIKGVHDVMKDTMELAAGLPKSANGDSDAHREIDGFLNSKDLEKGLLELQKLLVAVCNFAHEECGKLLSNVSSLDTASASQVCKLGQIVERFSRDCSEICSRGSAALRVAFQVQAARFVTRFHNERKEKLNAALDNECWRPADVPVAIQRFVSAVAAGKQISAVPDLVEVRKEASLIVGEERYILIGTVFVVLRLVSEYATVARDLSVLTLNFLRNLAELLMLFNSRSCQLILGAGAMQTAGFKTITTSHLVLTSRSLQLLMWFLPHIRKHFEDLAPENSQKGGKSSGNLLGEVESNMTDHISQLHTKVVLIVSGIIATELLAWAAKPPVPSQPFRNIYRNLTKLYEAVSGVLPVDQIEELFKKIHEAFKSAFGEQLKKLNIVNNGGPQHGTVTSELIFYSEMVKKLNVLPIEDLSDSLLADIWKSRQN